MNSTEKLTVPIQESNLEVFFSKWGKIIFYIVSGLAFLLLLGFYFFNRTADDTSFLDAKITMEKIRALPQDKEALEHMKSLLRESPRLNVYYNAHLANELSFHNEWEEMLPFAKSALTEGSIDSPYKQFSTTSLLIAEKRYEEALKSALVLQMQLIENPKYKLLDAYNLIRIASLYQVLDEPGKEREVWMQWTEFANNKDNQQVVLEMNELFKEGACCLADFIKFRLKTLA